MKSTRHFGALCAAASLVAAGIAAPAYAVELLSNRGFEAPTTGSTIDTTATGWTFVDPSTSTGTVQRAPFQNHTSATAGKSIWFRTFQPLDGGVYQNVPVVANGAYTLSVWDYFEANWATTGANILLSLRWRDASNALIGSGDTLTITPATNPPTGTWTQFTLNANAPSNAASVDAFLGLTNGGGSGAQLAVFADDVSLEGPGVAPASIWGVNASGDWNNAENWTNITVPNAAGASATLGSIISGPHTVYSDVAVTVGTLAFDNANTYVVAGAGSLTLQSPGSNSALVNVNAGTQKINLPLFVASNTTLNVASGATLLVADPVTVMAGKTLTPTGAGTVQYQSTVTVQTGGAITFASPTHAAGLTLQGTSNATVAAHAGSTQTLVQVDSLSIAGGSKLDLTNNALLTTTPATSMRTLLQTGAVFTSLSDANHGIGYADQGAGLTKARFTYNGDANLDGMVDVTDLGALATSWQTSGVWTQGDFNYDGTINVTDLGILATNWQMGVGNPLGPTFAEAAAALGLPNVSVPEPTSLGLLAVGVMGLVRRRR